MDDFGIGPVVSDIVLYVCYRNRLFWFMVVEGSEAKWQRSSRSGSRLRLDGKTDFSVWDDRGHYECGRHDFHYSWI